MQYFKDQDPEEPLRRLLRYAGPRPPVPEPLRSEIEAAAREAWRAKVATRTAVRRQRWALAAAVALAVLGALFFLVRTGWLGSGWRIATVEAMSGTLRDAAGTPLAPGAELAPGAVISTAADGGAALVLAGGTSLRLDAATRLRLVSARVLELEAGAVYLDTDASESGAGGASVGEPALEVRTALGTARDVGTQFSVRIEAQSLRVQVREGRVDVAYAGTGEASERVEAGHAVVLHASGEVERAAIDSWGAPWEWVLASAPPFALEGATVEQFLAWVGSETGWQVRYADPELAREAAAIVVHGSLGRLPPDQAPAVVLPSSGLDYRLEDGVLTVLRP